MLWKMLYFPERRVFIAAVIFNGVRDAEAKHQTTSCEQIVGIEVNIVHSLFDPLFYSIKASLKRATFCYP